jgi:hypothetical protein
LLHPRAKVASHVSPDDYPSDSAVARYDAVAVARSDISGRKSACSA